MYEDVLRASTRELECTTLRKLHFPVFGMVATNLLVDEDVSMAFSFGQSRTTSPASRMTGYVVEAIAT